MGYTRKRAVLSEIERHCAVALLAYSECAGALKAGEAPRFQRALELLRTAAGRLAQLLRPGETADWLGVPLNSPLHRWDSPARRPEAAGALRSWAGFYDSGALPDLMSAVAELNHRAEEEMAYLSQVV